jgi:hypothetical protein
MKIATMETLLNKKEINEIIKNLLATDNVVIHSYKILPITEEHLGFCAEYCRLKIEFNDVRSKKFYL